MEEIIEEINVMRIPASNAYSIALQLMDISGRASYFSSFQIKEECKTRGLNCEKVKKKKKRLTFAEMKFSKEEY